jgi:hypothetical protein
MIFEIPIKRTEHGMVRVEAESFEKAKEMAVTYANEGRAFWDDENIEVTGVNGDTEKQLINYEFEKFKAHKGHKIVCVGDGRGKDVNISLECEDCNEVLYSVDRA